MSDCKKFLIGFILTMVVLVNVISFLGDVDPELYDVTGIRNDLIGLVFILVGIFSLILILRRRTKMKLECKNCKSEGTCLDAPREECTDFRETDEARIRQIEAELKAHDYKLLDKVAERLKAETFVCKNCMIIDCDTEYFKPMCEKADKSCFVEEVCELVDEVIAEMKGDGNK